MRVWRRRAILHDDDNNKCGSSWCRNCRSDPGESKHHILPRACSYHVIAPRPNHTEYFWPVWTRLTRTIYRRVLLVRTSKCGWYPDPIMYIVWSPYVKGAYGCLGRCEHSNREQVVLVRPRTTLKRFVCGGNHDQTSIQPNHQVFHASLS